ncbi:hypothetical protein GCM10017557_67130 [Streptomyces aurantiacus]|uniref:Uncharacterized protein n=1 Tax=Streptomyces aurantiacus TaxID=47760 RepID=A0A7G1PCR3_9ACTN|nr:hypothetical protein GCM10017557_67130 [Streptomyces aurantiacus]
MCRVGREGPEKDSPENGSPAKGSPGPDIGRPDDDALGGVLGDVTVTGAGCGSAGGFAGMGRRRLVVSDGASSGAPARRAKGSKALGRGGAKGRGGVPGPGRRAVWPVAVGGSVAGRAGAGLSSPLVTEVRRGVLTGGGGTSGLGASRPTSRGSLAGRGGVSGLRGSRPLSPGALAGRGGTAAHSVPPTGALGAVVGRGGVAVPPGGVSGKRAEAGGGGGVDVGAWGALVGSAVGRRSGKRGASGEEVSRGPAPSDVRGRGGVPVGLGPNQAPVIPGSGVTFPRSVLWEAA